MFATSLQVRMRQAQGPLGRLIDIAGRQNSLAARVRDRLPESLRPHCLGAELHDGKLRITMDSPAWASRLRYLLPRLEDALKRLPMPEARSVDVRTGRPSRTSPAPGPGKPPRESSSGLSAESREHIRQSARCIPDPAIRRAFERLAGLKDDNS